MNTILFCFLSQKYYLYVLILWFVEYIIMQTFAGTFPKSANVTKYYEVDEYFKKKQQDTVKTTFMRSLQCLGYIVIDIVYNTISLM